MDSPTDAKRRRLLKGISGCSINSMDSSVDYNSSDLHSTDVSFVESEHMSDITSPSGSPSAFRSACTEFREKYKKDELWASIRSDYQYIMDKEIIETCKSTESDLSWDSDDNYSNNIKVSLTEFDAQYKELMEWLCQIQHLTLKQATSLSEKYLNQTYHEEMLQRTPRRKLLSDYAKHLVRRYPSMNDEVLSKMQHLHERWKQLEVKVTGHYGTLQHVSIIKDLEEDLNSLRQWLNCMETEVENMEDLRNKNVDVKELKKHLYHHNGRQRDIESRSKLVSSVLKLCGQLQSVSDPGMKTTSAPQSNVSPTTAGTMSSTAGSDWHGPADTGHALRMVAKSLETRWHNVWLKSLEWQCRLEEAVNTGKGFDGRGGRGLTDDHNTYKQQQLGLPSGVDSDHSTSSNCDVIPFSDHEYEKISIISDNDDYDDPLSPIYSGTDNRSPSFSGTQSSISSTTHSKITSTSSISNLDDICDSALGRSISDPSLDAEKLEASCRSKLSTNVVNLVEMHHGSRNMEQPAGSPIGKSIPKSESHDIGYASESHSTEEPDGVVALKKGSIASLALGADSSDNEYGSKDNRGDGSVDRFHKDTDSWSCNTKPDTDQSDNSDSGMITKDYKPYNVQPRGHVQQRHHPDRQCVQRLIEEADELIQYTSLQARLQGHRKRKPAECCSSDPQPSTEESEAAYVSSDLESEAAYVSSDLESEVAYGAFSSIDRDSDLQSHNTTINKTITDTNSSLCTNLSYGANTVCDLNLSGQTLIQTSSLSTLDRRRCLIARRRAKPTSYGNGATTSVPELYQHYNSLEEIFPRSRSDGALKDMSSSHYFSHNLQTHALRRSTSDHFSSLETHNKVQAIRHRRKNRRTKLGTNLLYHANCSDTKGFKKGQVLSSTPVTSTVHTKHKARRPAVIQNLFPMEASRADQVLSDDTDDMDTVQGAMNTSINSTMESFSENAWDNYQDPLYPSVSDDPTEEKLDDSKILWEDNSLEYDDDDDDSYNISMKNMQRQKKIRNMVSSTTHADSDSDLEDLQHVLKESRSQLQVSENALNKQRKDVMETGILLNSSKYGELLATCQTNSRCLQVILETLGSKNATNIVDYETQQIKELLLDWRCLQTMALKKQKQSRQLNDMYSVLCSCQKSLRTWAQKLQATQGYDSVQQVEQQIHLLQVIIQDMFVQNNKLKLLKDEIENFTFNNPSINMKQYQGDQNTMSYTLQMLISKCTDSIEELQNVVSCWYNFMEDSHEVTRTLQKHQQQLDCFKMAAQIVGLTQTDAENITKDVQDVEVELKSLDVKIQSLLQVCTKYLGSNLTQKVCERLLQETNSSRQQICALYEGYTELNLSLQELIRGSSTAPNTSPLSINNQTSIITKRIQQKHSSTQAGSNTKPESPPPPKTSPSPPTRRLHRVIIPILIASVLLLLLLDYSTSNGLKNLVFSPELKYVKGPPPM